MLEESSTSCTLPFLQLVLLDLFLTLGEQFLGVYTVIYRHPLTIDSAHPLAFFHCFPRMCDMTITLFLIRFLHLSVSQPLLLFPIVPHFEMFGLLGKKHINRELYKEEEIFNLANEAVHLFWYLLWYLFLITNKSAPDNLYLGSSLL